LLGVQFGTSLLAVYPVGTVPRQPGQPKTPSIYSPEYALVLSLLRKARKARGITQAQVAQKLQYQPSAISKIERGQLRLDIVQLRSYCQAIQLPLVAFVEQFEAALRELGENEGTPEPHERSP
jgi:ribosome-binding protein aMBF1 (putative translation factor)